MTILAEIYGDPISFSDPVRVLSIGRNPIQVLLIRSRFCQSDPIRSGPGFVNARNLSNIHKRARVLIGLANMQCFLAN